MPLFLENPPGGSGGSSQDRFAPKYVVGCTAAPYNDTAVAYNTGGFRYFPDTGNGLGIVAALAAADQDNGGLAGDVWIRPGIYTVTQTLDVPRDVVVRGSGPPTRIVSANDTIAGPLLSLKNKSALYSMSLAHNQPKVSAIQYGVVDLRVDDATALCEDVEVATLWANPTNSTLYGGFVSYNVGGGSGGTKLRCVRCSVSYDKNNASPVDYPTNLVGYRGRDASLELTDCSSQYTNFARGYGVILVNSNTGLGSLVVRGGTFSGYSGGIYADSNQNAVTTMLVDGAKVSCADQNNQSTCVGNIGAVSIVLANCTLNGGGSGQAIYLDPGAATIAYNRGSIVGNTINVAAPTLAWNSQGGALSGYHAILGNTYTGAAAPTTGTNDEVAHNINI